MVFLEDHGFSRRATMLSLRDLEERDDDEVKEVNKVEGNLGITKELNGLEMGMCCGVIYLRGLDSLLREFNKVKKIQLLLPKHCIESLDGSFCITVGYNNGKTPKKLLTNDASSGNAVDVNVVDSGRFTAIEVPNVLPSCENVDVEIDTTLQGVGALRACDLANDYDSDDTFFSSCQNTTKSKSKFANLIAYSALLVTATILATITYQAAVRAVATYKKNSRVNYHHTHDMSKQDLIMTRSFLMFNSVGFTASVAMIMFLLHEFPLKPWPQISILTMFGSYMCLIMAISPDEGLVLLLLAIPFLLLAAAGKLNPFAKRVLF